MKKWAVRLVAGAAIVLLVAVVVIVLILDGATRSAIERNATDALDVRTTLDGANVKLLGRRLDLHQLEVSSPEGFDETPRFVRLGHATTDLSLFDLPRERIELQQLLLEDVEVHLDRSGGRANYNVILENLKAFQDRGESDREKELFIHEVVLRDITVHVRVLPIGGDLTRLELSIPEIVIEDVGSGEDGVSTAKLVGVITTALLAGIFQQGADILPEDILKELGQGVAAVGELGQFGMTVAGETFQNAAGLIGAVAENLGSIGEEVIDGIGESLRGVGELFGGDRDDE